MSGNTNTGIGKFFAIKLDAHPAETAFAETGRALGLEDYIGADKAKGRGSSRTATAVTGHDLVHYQENLVVADAALLRLK